MKETFSSQLKRKELEKRKEEAATYLLATKEKLRLPGKSSFVKTPTIKSSLPSSPGKISTRKVTIKKSEKAGTVPVSEIKVEEPVIKTKKLSVDLDNDDEILVALEATKPVA